jgi:hypothetical protein
MWMVLLLPGALAAAFFVMPSRDGVRDRLLRAVVVWGVAIWALTELLGWLRLLDRAWLAIAWSVLILAVMVARAFRLLGPFSKGHRRRQETCPPESGHGRLKARATAVVWLSLAGIVALLAVTAVTAAFSPPNSADAMAYHMPRLVYWAEQAGVRFFPTPYLNQIMLQPMAEYFMLHTYLLSGGDQFINLVQWFASFGCMAAVSAIARRLGAGARGQAMAALFCATIPAGILASSGAKNDYLLALWLACAVYFALRFAATLGTADAVLLGCALGLALATKATAYLFAPWLMVAILMRRPAKCPHWVRSAAPRLMLAMAFVLVINAPQYARNLDLSGSPLGFDSAQGNGFYRWRNDTFGWKQTASNILRNSADQLGARSARWNQAVFEFVRTAHQRLKIDIADPATTWRGSAFSPPVNANHEANAPNRWHLATLCVLAGLAFWRALRGEHRDLALYALSLACGFVALCAYLKWQPFMARLVLPLFVLGSPLAAFAEDIRSVWIQVALCLFLLNNARPAAFENWVRPLKGPHSILHVRRDEMYFSDMGQWSNAASYPATALALRQSGCAVIGVDINNFQLEYPLQALLRESAPGVRFVHTGVENASRRYAQPVAAVPCAVACLDCLDDTKRLDLYGDFRTRITAGKFVVLLP